MSKSNHRNILVLKGDSDEYVHPFATWGLVLEDDLSYEIEDMDLIVFTGGTDVNPDLYGHNKLSTTQPPDTARDDYEQKVYTRAVLLGIPMVGICRGAQFLNVMNGGSLIQHVDNHTNCTHTLVLPNNDGTIHKHIDVKGDHHQMMVPSGEYNVLAYAEHLSAIYMTSPKVAEEQPPISDEPEVVYWPLTRCLGIQYHPEWHNPDTDGWDYFQELLDTYLM